MPKTPEELAHEKLAQQIMSAITEYTAATGDLVMTINVEVDANLDYASAIPVIGVPLFSPSAQAVLSGSEDPATDSLEYDSGEHDAPRVTLQ